MIAQASTDFVSWSLCGTSYDLLDKPDYKWPEAVRRQFAERVQSLLKPYSHLAKLSCAAKQCKWSQVSKFHMTAHMPEMSKHLTPRRTVSNPLWP